MKVVFADTFYFLALLNRHDAFHEKAVLASRAPDLRLVTTEFVLLELADALCRPGQRELVSAIFHIIETESAFRLVRLSPELFPKGKQLFQNRADKDWPLTNCISFTVMRDEGIEEALTADRHFEQAGFRTLLS
ncbi:MAG TPA: PIN domain-containing protein [Verrucomicrobiae bacterium]|nr:PIN domain-containing protein [Verrucomicrobiae bacterium]